MDISLFVVLKIFGAHDLWWERNSVILYLYYTSNDICSLSFAEALLKRETDLAAPKAQWARALRNGELPFPALLPHAARCNQSPVLIMPLRRSVTFVSECSVLGNRNKLHQHMQWNKNNWPSSFCWHYKMPLSPPPSRNPSFLQSVQFCRSCITKLLPVSPPIVSK